jgi:DUF1680 family protein
VRVTVRTGYPWDGHVELTVTADTPLTVALRIPSWCAAEDARLDGEPVVADGGYLRVRRDWSGGATIRLDLPMPARVVRPHPRIDAVRGCLALARGPLVYCLEQADLPDGVALEDVAIDPAATVAVDTGSPDFPVTLTATGAVETPTSAALYSAAAPGVRAEPITFTTVPYFLWGNRKPGPMRVWIPVTRHNLIVDDQR